MCKHFLIDFENIKHFSQFLQASYREQDHIYLFYSENACRLDLRGLPRDYVLHVDLLYTEPSKQSMDMSIMGYLGYLLSHSGPEDSFCVVSADLDYDKPLAFLRRIFPGREIEKVNPITQYGDTGRRSRQSQQSQQQGRRQNTKKQAERGRARRSGGRGQGREEELAEQRYYVEDYSEERGPLSYDSEASGLDEAEPYLAVEDLEAEPFLEDETEGRAEEDYAVEAQEPVKEAEEPEESEELEEAQAEQPSGKSIVNNRLVRKFSELKVPNREMGQLIKQMLKHYGTSAFRQKAYYLLIKRFGRQQGLELYREIKPLLAD